MNPTWEEEPRPAAKTLWRVLAAGGVIGWLTYAAVLAAMTLRLPRFSELLAGAAVIFLLLVLAAGWRRIARNG